jgi:hypothetical protein
MSDEELKSELERLRNENAALKKGASTGTRMKVSEKGPPARTPSPSATNMRQPGPLPLKAPRHRRLRSYV